MSGGSHNYICYQSSPAQSDLEYMAQRLRELGFVGLSEDTLTVGAFLGVDTYFSDIPTDVPQKLRDIWKAVEWYDSKDWGIEILEELAKNFEYP